MLFKEIKNRAGIYFQFSGKGNLLSETYIITTGGEAINLENGGRFVFDDNYDNEAVLCKHNYQSIAFKLNHIIEKLKNTVEIFEGYSKL